MSNVIHVDFKPKRPKTYPKTPTGVFIKPSGADMTMFSLNGNVAGFIASYIAFHPEFSPQLFGKQVRDELGVMTINDNTDPPDAA